MYKYTLTVYLCKIEALRMRYMGRRFYSDENKRVFQSVGKGWNSSWSMNGIHSGAEVRSLLKWGKRGDSIFLFLDKRESGIFTSVFEYLPWQGLMKRNDSSVDLLSEYRWDTRWCRCSGIGRSPRIVERWTLPMKVCVWSMKVSVWNMRVSVWSMKIREKRKIFCLSPFFQLPLYLIKKEWWYHEY